MTAGCDEANRGQVRLAAPPPWEGQMPEETTGLDLLLIEDEPNVAAMYALVLMRAGHQVRVLFDGRSGLKSTRRQPPDLVLLDVRLPDLDGYSLLEQLREDPDTAAVPVVILSNFRTPEMAQRGVELGAMAHMLKSETSPAQLRARIEAWREVGLIGPTPTPLETLDIT
jgi:DNA-binding response OmpR family regulator